MESVNHIYSFQWYKIILMANPEAYMVHQLNNSKTKEAHIFPKSVRFPMFNRMSTEAVYDLPSTKTKRSCTFGYGSKMDFTIKRCSPPPGSYKLQSQFEQKHNINAPSIAMGREGVKFGSFIDNVIKSQKDVPSPDRYHIRESWSKVGGKISQRINTEPDLKYQRSIPGPGEYKLTCTEMRQTGSYVLSGFKNQISPRLYAQRTIEKPHSNHHSTSYYDLEQKQNGKYSTSKFKNLIVRTFAKSKRPGMEDKSKKFVPGFKYRRFSEFGEQL